MCGEDTRNAVVFACADAITGLTPRQSYSTGEVVRVQKTDAARSAPQNPFVRKKARNPRQLFVEKSIEHYPSLAVESRQIFKTTDGSVSVSGGRGSLSSTITELRSQGTL